MNVLILTNPNHEDYLFQATEKFAKDHLIFVINNKADFERFTSHFSYDVGVSFMYPYRVPSEQLNHTWFNFHPGPLPEFKGRNLCYHAIMQGKTYFGATIHYMDENFDTGRIIDVLLFQIEDSDTAWDVNCKAIEASKRLFERYFLSILKGVPLHSEPNVGGDYYRREPINPYVEVDEDFKRQVRAITFGAFYPKVSIGGIDYKIVRDE